MTKSKISTAYHESGHAVISCELRKRFRKVSILEEGDSLGRLISISLKNFRPDIENDLRTRLLVEREIMISLAGYEAEKKLTGKNYWKGAKCDFEKCADLAFYVVVSEEEANAYLEWLRIRTKNKVSLPFIWERIEKLAKELVIHKELSYRKVREIIYSNY